MTETYDQYQVRMIRDARRAQQAADGEFARGRALVIAPKPLEVCQQCYDLGASAGIEREHAKRRGEWLAWLIIGALVGFVLGVALRPQFWGF